MCADRVPVPIWGHPAYAIACGFGMGAAPYAPGTAGTLLGIPIYLGLHLLPLWAYATALVLLLLVGVWACGRTARDGGVHDHGSIVWDEVVGFLITMSLADGAWWWIIAGFVLFRVFDILKPWPIAWLDRSITGGWGIMLDDVMAGVYACAALQVLGYAVNF